MIESSNCEVIINKDHKFETKANVFKTEFPKINKFAYMKRINRQLLWENKKF